MPNLSGADLDGLKEPGTYTVAAPVNAWDGAEGNIYVNVVADPLGTGVLLQQGANYSDRSTVVAKRSSMNVGWTPWTTEGTAGGQPLAPAGGPWAGQNGSWVPTVTSTEIGSPGVPYWDAQQMAMGNLSDPAGAPTDPVEGGQNAVNKRTLIAYVAVLEAQVAQLRADFDAYVAAHP